jgi:putative NIF3 family GTP cyclohydrolase 1 type 2
MGLVLAGHFASERFAMEQLAQSLAAHFVELEVWASTSERDPIRHV